MLKTLAERNHDYDANTFINELFEASNKLGRLEAKIYSYQFDSILIPMFMNKEALSSMLIEGTQTTITDIFEDNIKESKDPSDKVMLEYRNQTKAILFGTEYLRTSGFTDTLMKNLHEIMMKGVLPDQKNSGIGKYKERDNYIVNSAGTVVFTPPSHTETQKYMRDLLYFMNNSSDSTNPLIKAAMIHSQFESIHPFEDGNGRVGRLLVSLYLYKSKVINFPFFYISEAISEDKLVYYNKLTDSRKSNLNEWIRFFLQKIIVQSDKLIGYIDNLNTLYEKTKTKVKEVINSTKCDQILECIFTQPILTTSYLAEKISVTPGQSKRYIDKLVDKQILLGDDRIRGRKYYFIELLDLARK